MQNRGLLLADVRRFFLERHIVLKENWLEAAVSFVSQGCRNKQVMAAVFHQWTLIAINETTQPTLGTLRGQLNSRHYAVAMVLQIKSVDDIGSSLWAQSKKARGARVCDNPEFAEEGEDTDQPGYGEIGARLLRLMLTDGVDTIKAIEYKRIPSITVRTPSGTKILLYGSYPSLLLKKDIFLLTPQNCQLLGGPLDAA